MHPAPPDGLKPRKTPRQARAEATLDAIFEATIQVLLAVGERRLTTTRVAERAGVSVGTMHQYFPHKQALLYAVLQWHLAHISAVVEVACQRCRGRPAAEMADGLVNAFLDAKTERLDVTKALYLIAEDLDTTTLLADATSRNVAATTTMLATAADADFENLLAVASTMFSGIAGSTRIVFERGASLFALQELRRELSLMCRSYCSHLDEPGRATKMWGSSGMSYAASPLLAPEPSPQSPLWVISGHCPASASCLLYSQKRTFVSALSMSAKCQ